MALTGAPRAWLLHLPAASVASWEELRSLFPAHHATPTPPVVAALLGGSKALPTSHHIKPFIRWVSAASTRQGALPDRAGPKAGLTFSSEDHPSNSACSGALPMLCTPTICQVAVTRTLIDGGAGLSVLLVEAFNLLCIPLERLQPNRPFSGVGADHPAPWDRSGSQ